MNVLHASLPGHRHPPAKHENASLTSNPNETLSIDKHSSLTKHVPILCAVLHSILIHAYIPTDTTITLTTSANLHVYNDPTNFTKCPYMLSPTPSLAILKKYGTEYAIILNNAYLCSLDRKVFENRTKCLWEIQQNAYGYFLRRDGLCYRGGCTMVECNNNDEDQNYLLIEKELCVASDNSTLAGRIRNRMMGSKVESEDGDDDKSGVIKKMEEKYGRIGKKMKALINALHKDKKKKKRKSRKGLSWKRPSWKGVKLSLC
ncbi:hypothetical protein THOM_1161 [Trachipleistophora hominis]|uniref:Uncharacterized protein n=1 Tax=Trachipleistophora hominis TaxID=72359 RepID=L7JXU6_TRAHO|nr:hypothetical protein THOM_1161 [Trachipleistophora hominis]